MFDFCPILVCDKENNMYIAKEEISQLIDDLGENLVSWRRHLHENPEASLKEYDTCQFIQDKLSNWGIPFEQVGETGTLAIIKGEQGAGKTVLLRADIDALELEDLKDVPYKSKRKGLNHACGHDGHTAMGLGTAKVLYALKGRFKGTVLIAFQQAEEIGAGAKQFIQSGLLNDMDESIGLHLKADELFGTFLSKGKAVNASCDIFKIDVTGKSAHVGLPHKSFDALVCASQIVVALQSIVSREISPVDQAVVGIGKLNAGSRYNIVANSATLEGTIRAFSHETRAHLKEAIERIASSIAVAYRCDIAFDWYDASAPVINDEVLAQSACEVAKTTEGITEIKDNYEINMTADDYADYMIDKPGVYVLLGSQSGEDTAYGHHHEKFNIDENILKIGVRFEVNYLLKRLNQ